ncbi:hypothetical protein FJY90_00730 [Candidatus Gottesmanbacteria bacterium]|nr:hypothetical protein [Candidatus Gottesmanbacteria bacterium]
MIEPINVLLFAVVVILTILMVVIGWQIYLILGEVRKMMMKFNTIADGAVSFTGNISKSFHNLTGFSDGLKTVLGLFRVFKKEHKKDE